MLAAKLSACTWSRIPTWVSMRCSNPGDEYLDNEYSESDFDNYVEILFREFAENIKVKYSQVRDILYGHNTQFFEEKARYFSDYDYMQPREDDFKSLTSKLLLPSVFELEKKSNVQAFLDGFDELGLEEKVEILDRLSNAKIEFGVLDVGPSNSVGKTIVSLSEATKYKLIRSVFDAEVNIDVELR